MYLAPIECIEDLAKTIRQKVTKVVAATTYVEHERNTMLSQSYYTELEHPSSNVKAVEKELAELETDMKGVDNAVQTAQTGGFAKEAVVDLCSYKQWAEADKETKQTKLVHMENKYE
eukprot:12538-Eustigmatos_ZCMA.PRE.1